MARADKDKFYAIKGDRLIGLVDFITNNITYNTASKIIDDLSSMVEVVTTTDKKETESDSEGGQ